MRDSSRDRERARLTRARCIYCGAKTRGGRACAAHADLTRLDPNVSAALRGASGRLTNAAPRHSVPSVNEPQAAGASKPPRGSVG